MTLKDNIEIKARKRSLYLAFILIAIWILSVGISYTPLVQNYWVNFIVILIVQNTMNLLLIIIILLVVYVAEKKIIEQKITDYERKIGKK